MCTIQQVYVSAGLLPPSAAEPHHFRGTLLASRLVGSAKGFQGMSQATLLLVL